jgi:N-acetylneuraminic acid mutarotase
MHHSWFSCFLALIKLIAQQRTHRRARRAFGLMAIALLVLAGPACRLANAQTNEWTWMGGSLTQGSLGVYGTLGAPASGNAPGGRYGAVTWTDSQGNFWLFGGLGIGSGPGAFHGFLNDLWKFNLSTNEWSWMSGSASLPNNWAEGTGEYGTLGVPAVGNVPPGREGAAGWVDSKGNFWLFGGYDVADYFDDLWEYNPSTNEWTWMGGSDIPNQAGVYGTLLKPAAGNMPGARYEAVSWTDSKGNFWLFGGDGLDSTGALQNLNDLWEYSPSTNQWTWVSGSNTAGQASVPGTQGAPAQGNTPGARNSASGWTDHQGNLWLFGGTSAEGNPGLPSGSPFNDLWEFNPSTNEWAWISGNTSPEGPGMGPSGVYGTLQTPATDNVPGARVGAAAWTDSAGNLWLFGGQGFDSAGTYAWLNDLWEFNPAGNDWTWMAGSSVVPNDCASYLEFCGELGEYGVVQSPGLGNVPGSRSAVASWTDSKGNFWLFGGNGFDAEGDGDADGNSGYLSDLWEFQPNTGGQPVTTTPVVSPASGAYTSWQTVTIDDSTPGATIDYMINGVPPALQYTDPITVTSTETIEAIASATGYANSNIVTARYTASLPVAATPTFRVAPGTYANAQTVSISDATPGATIYYAIGSAPTTPNIAYTGPFSVSSSETLQAMAVAENYLNSTVAIGAYVIGSNPSGQWTWMGGSNLIPSGCSDSGGCAALGWYGTLRTPAAANMPGARSSAASWIDVKGNFWLFGGLGWDSADDTGFLNDLWEFSPSTAEWTWMGGSSTIPACTSAGGCGQAGTYGTLGTPSAKNSPGARDNAASWTDANGNFWLFGGYGFDADDTLGFLNDLWKFEPTSNEWTWMGGSEFVACLFCGPEGVYGTFTTPAAGNVPGGRTEALTWTDHNGNLWMFGGLGEDASDFECYLNDLWEFNPSTSQWAWMSGFPNCYQRMTGYQGIYGEIGVPAAGNLPWSYTLSSTWTDSAGHLWLFGGIGEDYSATGYYFNDMWEYYPSINEWAWTSANSVGAGGTGLGVYGTMSDWSPANIPGGREASESWTDGDGNFWLLGGDGIIGSSFLLGALNDLWEFKPSINEWAWMGGSSTSVCLSTNDNICVSWGQPGVYGALGTPAPGNVPGGRYAAATWTDSNGNLWLFGGEGDDSAGNSGTLNDLWQYGLKGPPSVAPPSPAATPTFSLAPGTYSSIQTLTISDSTPGATIYYTTNATVPNSSSTIYTGQFAVPSSETVEAVAVASGFSVSTAAIGVYTLNLPPAATPSFNVPGGTYTAAQAVTISDATQGATIYYTTNGATPTTSSTVYSGAITVSSSETIEAIAVVNGYSLSAVASATYTINLPANFMLSAAPGALTVYSSSQGIVTLTATPQNGFDSTVSFACSGLPAEVSGSFNPTTVNPSGSAVTTTLTFTASAQAVLTRIHPRTPLLPTAALAIGVYVLLVKRRRVLPMFLFFVALIELSLLSACGGSGATGSGDGGGGTQETATVTVTATSGSIQQSTTITLTVN